jgi:multidrug efflux system outer membrane protein
VAARRSAELSRADEALQLQQLRDTVLDQLGLYDTAMQLHRVAIAALVRQTPASLPAFTAQALPEPATALPAAASLDLMARRPDLIAARGRVAAATADADAARAGFLPDVDLRALFGLSSRDLEHLLETGSWAPQFTAALHLPVFDAGRVRSRHAGAQAELRATVADYNDRLLRAAEEVNGALVERAAVAERLHTGERQLATSAGLRALTQQRADAGLSDARPPLAATRQWLDTQEALLHIRQQQWDTELKLIRALGGGYGAGDERQR